MQPPNAALEACRSQRSEVGKVETRRRRTGVRRPMLGAIGIVTVGVVDVGAGGLGMKARRVPLGGDVTLVGS